MLALVDGAPARGLDRMAVPLVHEAPSTSVALFVEVFPVLKRVGVEARHLGSKRKTEAFGH